MKCGCIPEIDQPDPKKPRVRRPHSGTECSCGRTKRPRSAFCDTCHAQLPSWAKTGLKETGAADYSAAYERARDWLIRFGR